MSALERAAVLKKASFCFLVSCCFSGAGKAASVSGTVASAAGNPVQGARVTLFDPSLALFREARTGAEGLYSLDGVPEGSYRIGAAATDLEYQEASIVVGAAGAQKDFALGLETQSGRWSVVGSTLPEFFDATDIAILRADGKVFFCHDTEDPVVFDPVKAVKSFPTGSGSAQGCMNGTVLEDGRIIMVGGQTPEDPGSFRNAVRWVKTYSPASDSWTRLSDLQLTDGRWYTGIARLVDGSLMSMGGGTRPDAKRTATCERFDLSSQTWSFTGSMQNPTEFPPSALLHTGEVLITWWPPQLYDPSTGIWRKTGNFNQPNRGWPNHSDHSLVMLSDGRALAIGIRRGTDGNSVMGEIYDPSTETWRLTSNPDLVRFQTEVVQLPDGRILAAGGETEVKPAPVPDTLGIVKWCDLYDPGRDRWRRVADMKWFREYHAVTLLVPDGRVIMTGGTEIKFQVGPTSADIEAFEPPYLFRGVRPRILSLSSTTLARGAPLSLEIAPETGITSLVLMGTSSTTHWVDSGVPRRVVLPASQSGTNVNADLPEDPNLLPLGHYILFAMVDDIPSVGVIVNINRPPARFIRGDWNQDGSLDISDAVATLLYLFRDGALTACIAAGDSNDDHSLDISDPVYDLLYLYGSGSPPPAPFPLCSLDPSSGTLSCEVDSPCN
jgi:hypothetical protein